MQERESSMRSRTGLMHSRKNWRWGLLLSGTNVLSTHYLVQLNMAIVVVSSFQPISSVLRVLKRTLGDITD